MNTVTVNKLALELFDCVLDTNTSSDLVINTTQGYIISPSAVYAKSSIEEFYKNKELNGEQLNKTFHKSWDKIANITEQEFRMHQLMHYISTYGTDFEGETYIPYEYLNVPKLEGGITFKTILALIPDELIEKCLVMLNGIALKEETMKMVVDLLKILDFKNHPLSNTKISNKEASIVLVEELGVLPKEPQEVLRYVVYKYTGNTLLVKSKDVIDTIKDSTSYNPLEIFEEYGLNKLAQIFNRFKQLFLAMKSSGSPELKSCINKISRLSKKLHVPMIVNPLNEVTSKKLSEKDSHWLENATIYAIFKAINACKRRVESDSTNFTYKIRTGKSFTKSTDIRKEICKFNLNVLLNFLKSKLNLQGKKFLLDRNVQYALPTSEKMFVGNIPFYTKITGKNLAVGIYWENSWGARDLDLSSVDLSGSKIGWNADFRTDNNSLMFSGDITSAPSGAVEYLLASGGKSANPCLVTCNVYSGSSTSSYNVIVGQTEFTPDRSKRGEGQAYQYMMDPNNLIMSEKVQAVQNNMIIGMMRPINESEMEYIVINYGAGSLRVSAGTELSIQSLKAFIADIDTCMTFNQLLELCNGQVVYEVEKEEENVEDFRIKALSRDSFISLFK